MNNKEYTVYVKTTNGSGTFGNIILLPGIIGGSTGGQLVTSKTSAYSISGELTIGGDFAGTDTNIYNGYSMGDYDAAITDAVKFTSGGVLNLSAQTGDMQTQYAANSQFNDSNINIQTNTIKHIEQVHNKTYVASGKYEATALHSTSGTLEIVSDLVGNIKTYNDVSLTGYKDQQGNKLDNSSGNTVNAAGIRTQATTIKNNFSANILAQQRALIFCYKNASANNNTVTVQGIWAENGNLLFEGNVGKRTTIPSGYNYSGVIVAETTEVSIQGSCNYADVETLMRKKLSQEQWDTLRLTLTEDEAAKYTPTSDGYYLEPVEKAITLAAYNKLTIGEQLQYKWEEYTPAVPDVDASATGNEVAAYGLRADGHSIIMKRDFEADITSNLSNVTINAIANGADKTPVLSATLKSYGMYADSFEVGGTFKGIVKSQASDIHLETSGGTKTSDNNSFKFSAAALYFEKTISVENYFSGDLKLLWKDSSYTFGKTSFDVDVYGLYAGTSLTVGNGRGLIDTNIEIGTQNAYHTTRLTGVYTNSINAESFGATITVNGTGYRDLAIGIQTLKFANNVDSVFNTISSTFDIIGDIAVSGSGANIAILVATPGAIQLRISSNITVRGSTSQANYAIWAGSWAWDDSIKMWKGTYNGGGDDKLEIAAGATVIGNVDLADGSDIIYIDSNARVNGDIVNRGGQKNLTFTLNQYGSVNADDPNSFRNSAVTDLIYTGNFAPETTTIVIDANDADSGEVYYLLANQAVTLGNKDITVVYNAETRILSIKNSTGKVEFSNGTTVIGNIVNGALSVVVNKASISVDTKIANAVNLTVGNDTISWTLSNQYDQTKYDSSYTLRVSYDVYNADGSFNKTVTNDVKCQAGNIGIEGTDITVKNVHAAIIKNTTSERVNTLSVAGSMNNETGVFRLDWTLSLSEAISSSYRYELEYSVKKAGSGTYSNSTVVSMDYLSSFYELQNIEEGDSVRARIRVKRVGSTEEFNVGEWSDTIEMTNTAPKEEVAKVTNLLNNRTGAVTTALMLLEWSDMRDAFSAGLSHYVVQFFDAGLTGNLTDSQLEAIWNGQNSDYTVMTRLTTSNMFYLSNNDNNKNYYWRVQAVSNNGTAGTWSDTSQYKPVGEDNTPPVKTPKCDVTTINTSFDYLANSITWSWVNELAVDESASGVTTYLLYYKPESDSDYKTILLSSNKNSSYTTTLVGAPPLNQRYDYYITARDAAGNESAVLKKGTVQGDITAPVDGKLTWNEPENKNDLYVDNSAGGKDFIVSLTIDCATDPAIVGEVDSPSGVKSYTLQRLKGSSGGKDIWVTIDVYYASDIKGDSFTVTAPGIDTRDIPANSDNKCPTYWRLLVEDNAGNIATINTPPIVAVQPGNITFGQSSFISKPEVVAYNDNQNFTVTFEWKEAISSPYLIASYNLYISEDGTTWQLVQNITDVNKTIITAQLTEKDGLKGNTTYKWAVEAIDAEGFSSGKQTAIEEYDHFTTPKYTPPPETFTFKDEKLSVIYNNDLLNITISWSIGSGTSTGYELKRAVAGTGVYETFMTGDANTTQFNFTVSSGTLYDYIVVAKDKNYPDVSVTSKVLNTRTDVTTPVFTSTNTTLTNLGNNNYYLTWSGAVDPKGAEGEPVSGLKEYNLYFSTSSTLGSDAICITVGGATDYNLTKDLLIANGITGGTYYWWVGAKDWAGNEGTLQGQGSFFVKLTPPKGEFTTLDSSMGVSYSYVEDPTVENGALVRQPNDINVTFNVGSTFSDPDGITYRIELASSADFADKYILLSETFTGSSFTLSTANNGIAYIAMMAQGKNGYNSTYNDVPDIYWRVCAIDAYGNETAYSKTNSFKLADKDLDRSLNDYYAPDKVELYAPEEVAGSNGTQWNLKWSPVSDPFGIYTYEIALSNGVDTMYFWTDKSISDTFVVIGGKDLPVSAGTYTVTVTAIDGSGKRSPVSNSQTVHCSVQNPDYPGSGTSTLDPAPLTNSSGTPDRTYSATITSTIGTSGNTEHYFRYDGVTKNGVLDFSITGLSQKVKITLYANSDSGKWKKLKSFTVNAGGGTLLSNYLLASNLYYVKVEAMDKKKFSTQTSYELNFNSTYFPDPTPNKDFSTASEIVLTTNNNQKTGSVSGFVGYLEAKDYYVINSDIAGSLNISVTTSANVKITVYDSVYKKLASATAKAGSYSYLFKKNALCPAGKVYIVVEASDKGKGKQNADYTVGVTDNLFQPATPNNDFSTAQSIYVDSNGQGLFSNGWVGYGDKIDMYKFVSASNGAVELGITEVESKLKVTLYDAAGKKLKSKTITGSPSAKYATADIFGKDVLLNAGNTYYIAVESGDKGKGYQNSFYNLSVNETYAPVSHGNNTKASAMSLAAGQTITDWVGYGEVSDFYKITLTGAGSYIDLNFNVNGKVDVKMTSQQGSSSGSVSLQKTDNGYSTKNMLAAGEYFLEIRAKSPNNVNSWSNSYNLAYTTR